jgi:hypothetical protein
MVVDHCGECGFHKGATRTRRAGRGRERRAKGNVEMHGGGRWHNGAYACGWLLATMTWYWPSTSGVRGGD